MGIPPALAQAATDSASAASDLSFLSLFTALAVGMVAGFVWLLTRRSRPRVALAAVVIGVGLGILSFTPPPRAWSEDQSEGFLTGTASFVVPGAEVGAPSMRGAGEARAEPEGNGTRIVLTCPERCGFFLGTAPLPRDALEVRLEGGPFLLRVETYQCQRLPTTPWLLAGAPDPCVACEETQFLTAKGEGSVQRLAGASRRLC